MTCTPGTEGRLGGRYEGDRLVSTKDNERWVLNSVGGSFPVDTSPPRPGRPLCRTATLKSVPPVTSLGRQSTCGVVLTPVVSRSTSGKRDGGSGPICDVHDNCTCIWLVGLNGCKCARLRRLRTVFLRSSTQKNRSRLCPTHRSASPSPSVPLDQRSGLSGSLRSLRIPVLRFLPSV